MEEINMKNHKRDLILIGILLLTALILFLLFKDKQLKEPDAVAVEFDVIEPKIEKFDVTLYVISIPTIDGNILFAAYTDVSEYEESDT